MAAQLGHQATGVFLVVPPVDFTLQFGRRDGPAPVAVAVPERFDPLYFAEHSRTDHFDRLQVDRVEKPLLVDEKDVPRPFMGLVHRQRVRQRPGH